MYTVKGTIDIEGAITQFAPLVKRNSGTLKTLSRFSVQANLCSVNLAP